MSTPGVVGLAIGAIVLLGVLMWMVTRASVPERLARTDAAAGTGHGTAFSAHADTGRPADAAAEDMLPLTGDAAPAPPPAERPPARSAPVTRPVDPQAPGRSVDDTDADEAVEPNEPA